ncbi:isochorismatase family cysteine hydrolase [Amycolatopsis japonica]|uniref:isochorismatase family cysteine hydrolase n=1 Tax=Amycolatopsis japonica TaxID=208439 RepID=UPI00366FC2EB
MNNGNSVLLVVDMQAGFVSSKSAPVVPHVVDLVNRWEALGRDVVFTRFINRPGSQFERLIHWSRFMPGAEEVEIIDELAPHAARAAAVVDKVGQYSPFTTEFTRLVNLHGWSQMVICGIATESCVMKSACDAFEQGYTPWVVTDACASHAGADKHEAGLLVIKRFIGRGQLVDAASVIDGSAQAA